MSFTANIGQEAVNSVPPVVADTTAAFIVNDTVVDGSTGDDGTVLKALIGFAKVAFATDTDASGWGAAWANLAADNTAYVAIRQHLANWQDTIISAE